MRKPFWFLLLLLAAWQPALAQQKKQTPKPAVKTQPAPYGQGILQFDYNKYDFGKINEKGGNVYHSFRFQNVGTGPIRVLKVVTSCGCTSSEWPPEAVPPGGTAVVKVGFDPNGRQGVFNKTISVETDGQPASQSLYITGNVFPPRKDYASTYRYQYGNIAVQSNMVNFSAVKHSGYDSAEVGLYNLGNQTIRIYKIEGPANIRFTKAYDYLPPSTDLKIMVKYYPEQPVEFGPIKQEFKVFTSDDSLPVKRFFVSANIVEDFGALGPKELKRAPKAKLNTNEIDLGNVPLFNSPVAKFTITNKGKEDLVIRRVIRTCTCLNPELSKKVLKKGESATLDLTWSLANMAGPDTKTIKLITNDPTQPEITLTVKINVTE